MGGEIESSRKRRKDPSNRNNQAKKKSMPRFGRDGRGGKRKRQEDDGEESLRARGRKDGAGATGPLLTRGGGGNSERKKREEHDSESDSSKEDARVSRSLKTRRTYGAGNNVKNYRACATDPLYIRGCASPEECHSFRHGTPGPGSQQPGGAPRMNNSAIAMALSKRTRIGVPGPYSENSVLQKGEDASVIVVAPGWCHPADEFGEAIKLVLFGPRAPTDMQAEYLSGPAPQAVTTAIVHIRGCYRSYLSIHKQGMAAQARLMTPKATFFDNLWNRGVIKQAVADLLEPQQLSHTKCFECSNAAEWVTSCCGLKLCSQCLPQRFAQNHNRGDSRRLCHGKGAIGVLNPQAQFTPNARYQVEDDMMCTRQLLLQVEDEENQRTRVRDIFVLRSVLPLSDIWSRKDFPRRHTYFYHLRWDGHLTLLFRIGGELPFL